MAFGMIMLRLLVGLTLAAHGSQKLFGLVGGSGLAGTQKMFAGLGFRTPLVMAIVAGMSEFGGGLLFASGLLTPVAALALTVVMLNAIATVHWRKGFFNYAGGYEYNLLILTTALAVTATGPGRLSLDAAFGWAGRISGPWWALGIAIVAPTITLVTLTVGRARPMTAAAAAAATPAATPNEQRWTSA
jgi:putative oxidoreductase